MNYEFSVTHHKILFDMDHLINRTLTMQYPQYSQEELCSCPCRNHITNKVKLSRSQPPPLKERPANLQQNSHSEISITPVLKRKRSQENIEAKKTKETADQDPLDTNGILIMDDTNITPEDTDPSWSMGCLYR